MSILTKSRLTSLTETKLGYRAFSEVLNEAKISGKFYSSTNTFLSHSHDDLKNGYLDKAIVFLKNVGIKIYIDSKDSSLPPFTNEETAKRIKEQIRLNKKFILLATTNAIASKWCNWELGYGDSQKYINHIALFPLADSLESWTGHEYLKIYPRIEESNYTTDYFKIIFPDGNEKSIYEWLNL